MQLGPFTLLLVTTAWSVSASGLRVLGAAPQGSEVLDHVSFVSLSDGWVHGGSELWATHDGCKTWQKITLPSVKSDTAASIRAARLLGPREGWVLFGNRLFHTESDGADWREISAPFPRGAWIGTAYFLPGVRVGWVGGSITDYSPKTRDVTRYVLAHTKDGGRTWRNQKLSFAGSAVRLLSFLDRRTGFAFSDGPVERTTDGGKVWTAVRFRSACDSERQRTSPGESHGTAVYFLDSRRGWLSVFGDLFATRDGNNWCQVTPAQQLWRTSAWGGFTAMHFDSDKHGWAVSAVAGGDFLLRETFDGGGRWQKLEIDDHFFDIGSISPSRAVILSSVLLYLAGN